MGKRSNRFLGFVIAVSLFLSVSSTSDAYYVYRPFHNNVYVGGATVGWGVYGWPVVVGVGISGWPVFGNAYYPYYQYEPYYPTYGAIAYSKTTKRVGISYNHSTRADAEKDAVGYCGEEDCKPTVWVAGGCGALAGSAEGQLGYAYAADKYYAQSYAMRGCKQGGTKDCKQVAWVCSY